MDNQANSLGLPETEPLLIDSKAASALLGIGARRLWSLTNCGAIPSRKIGRSVRYAPDELRAWIAAGCPIESGVGEAICKRQRAGVR